MPKTTFGRWSLGLILVMPLLFYIGGSLSTSLYNSVPAGDSIPADIVQRPALALTMLAGMLAGIAAFVTGLVAIIKHKERTIFVIVSTAVGGLLILFLIGEVAFPH